MTIKPAPLFSRLLFCCLVVFFCSYAHPSKAATTWNPTKTWVFFVGILEWKDPSNPSFPQKNRKDVVLLDRLRKNAVREEHVVSLADRAAATANVKKQFDSFLKEAGPDDWVFVY